MTLPVKHWRQTKMVQERTNLHAKKTCSINHGTIWQEHVFSVNEAFYKRNSKTVGKIIFPHHTKRKIAESAVSAVQSSVPSCSRHSGDVDDDAGDGGDDVGGVSSVDDDDGGGGDNVDEDVGVRVGAAPNRGRGLCAHPR